MSRSSLTPIAPSFQGWGGWVLGIAVACGGCKKVGKFLNYVWLALGNLVAVPWYFGFVFFLVDVNVLETAFVIVCVWVYE